MLLPVSMVKPFGRSVESFLLVRGLQEDSFFSRIIVLCLGTIADLCPFFLEVASFLVVV